MEGLATPQNEDNLFPGDVFSEETEQLLEHANIWRRQDSFAGPTFLKQSAPTQFYEFENAFSSSTAGDKQGEDNNETSQTDNDNIVNDNPPPPVDRSTKPKLIKETIVMAQKNTDLSRMAPPSSLLLHISKPPPLPPKPQFNIVVKEGVTPDAEALSLAGLSDSVKKNQRNSALSRGSATSSETVVASEDDVVTREAIKSISSSEGSHELNTDAAERRMEEVSQSKDEADSTVRFKIVSICF